MCAPLILTSYDGLFRAYLLSTDVLSLVRMCELFCRAFFDQGVCFNSKRFQSGHRCVLLCICTQLQHCLTGVQYHLLSFCL